MMKNNICHYLSENDDRYEYARFCNSDTSHTNYYFELTRCLVINLIVQLNLNDLNHLPSKFKSKYLMHESRPVDKSLRCLYVEGGVDEKMAIGSICECYNNLYCLWWFLGSRIPCALPTFS